MKCQKIHARQKNKFFILTPFFTFMFFGLISIISVFIGLIIANYTKDEYKQGKFYFNILEIIILISLIIITINYNFNYLLLIFGIIIGFIVRYEYFYFSIFIISIINKNYNFLVSSLTFLYGLPFGTLIFKNIKNYKTLILQLTLFFIPIILYFFKFNLISIASGALISIFLLKIHSLLNFKFNH